MSTEELEALRNYERRANDLFQMLQRGTTHEMNSVDAKCVLCGAKANWSKGGIVAHSTSCELGKLLKDYAFRHSRPPVPVDLKKLGIEPSPEHRQPGTPP